MDYDPSAPRPRPRRLGVAGLIVVLAVLYSLWMTGGSLRFSEIRLFPNHLMLARAFASGRLDISDAPRVDTISFAGRRYFYFGPVPAALRTPLEVLGIDPPTGLMVCLLAAGVVGLFAAVARELAPAPRVQWLRRVFVVVFAVNGLTLFMVSLPSIHHESILWAMLFLLAALLAFFRAVHGTFTGGRAVLVGTAAALAVGSRFSYLPAAVVLVVVSGIVAVRQGAGRPRRKLLLVAAPLVVMVGGMLLYNEVRFQSPFDFGLTRSASRYQTYMRAGHYWRLDHVPYNLWDYLARLPEPSSGFPYLEATISMSEVTKRSAVPRPSYRLLHVNELALSVFVVLPLTALLFPSLGRLRREADPEERMPAALLGALAAVQLGVLSLTMLSTARFMFDFVPLLMLMALLGAVTLAGRQPAVARRITAALAVLSLAVSLLLPLSAAAQYGAFLDYQGPLSTLTASSP